MQNKYFILDIQKRILDIQNHYFLSDIQKKTFILDIRNYFWIGLSEIIIMDI